MADIVLLLIPGTDHCLLTQSISTDTHFILRSDKFMVLRQLMKKLIAVIVS